MLRPNEKDACGFSLIEAVIAVAVLSIGLMGVALLVTRTLASGTRARYMNMANVLASEKLDSLNKWPSTNANVSPGGALTGSSTCATGDTYCDQITVSESSGADYETQAQVDSDGNNVTTTIVHTSSGCVDTPTNCSVASPPANGATFTRRWLITANPTLTAVSGGGTFTVPQVTIDAPTKLITVVVTLDNLSIQPPVTFQMSMVRP